MYNATMEFRLGELFCGPGGLGLAAVKSLPVRDKDGVEFSIKHAWATDYDADACQTYAQNICPTEKHSVICHDIRTLDFSVLRDISEIDGLAFGFPCNDFSAVGQRLGFNGEYGPLYSYGVKALLEFKPRWFLAENVGGLRNSNEGSALTVILSELERSGYRVYPHLYRFEEYGVPQARHRIIIVGIRNDEKVEFKVPAPTCENGKYITCYSALMEPKINPTALNNELTKQSHVVVERLKHIKPGQNAFNADLPSHLKLNVKGATISQIYRRLDPTRPAYTVTGSGGGGTHVYHWSENRALTNRERARLQTFPDSFAFYGSKESVRRQIGMAVPVIGARIIFEAILKSFAGQEYESITCNISHQNSKFTFAETA